MQNLERWLGDILSSAVTTANGILDDPLVKKTLVRISNSLFTTSSAPRILVLETAVINAWTLPGNTVLITRGLIVWAETDDILAGVIAHELGHVERHHAWRQLSQSILLKVVLDRIPTKSRSLRMLLNGITILLSLSWSRSHELEADRFATERLLMSGFSHDAWWRFLDESAGSSVIAELVSTHPSDSTRIRNLKANFNSKLQSQFPPERVASLRRGRLGIPSLGANTRGKTNSDKWEAAGQYRQRLRKSFAPQSLIAPLQRLILWNVPVNDIAILVVAGHVFALQEQLADILATLSVAVGTLDANTGARATPLLDRAIANANQAQTAIGLVLADIHTRLDEPHGRALAAKGTRFAVREGLLLKAQQELDTALGAVSRLDYIVDGVRLSNAASRLNAVLAYNIARESCVILLRRDGIPMVAIADATDMTVDVLRRLITIENPKSRTGFSYIDTTEVAIEAALEQGCAWSVARYVDALAAELEGVEVL